jgi:hypothetical protein
MHGYMAELNIANDDLAEWKNELPAYYEPISLPVLDESAAFGKYPYKTRMDYVTSTSTRNTNAAFVGHTMNLYRAARMRLDRQLIGHMFPNAGPSAEELRYFLS